MPRVTEHQLWQHEVTGEQWAVRIESGMLTGIYGPLSPAQAAGDLADVLYDEHPDDLEWVFRNSERFMVIGPATLTGSSRRVGLSSSSLRPRLPD